MQGNLAIDTFYKSGSLDAMNLLLFKIGGAVVTTISFPWSQMSSSFSDRISYEEEIRK